MKIKELKKIAKEQINGKIFKLFMVYALIFVINFIFVWFPVLGKIIIILISPSIGLGLCIIYLQIINNKEVDLENIFTGMNLMWRALWLNILTIVFTLLWSLLFFIPGIIKAYSYSMAFYVLAENQNISAIEALNISKKIMKGHKWELFKLQLSFLGWFLLGIITFGIASIYVVPYMNTAIANFYNLIKE